MTTVEESLMTRRKKLVAYVKRRVADQDLAEDRFRTASRRCSKRVLISKFRALMPTLKPEYGQLIERLELAGDNPAEVATQLRISRGNLKVRRHRARQALRQRLEESCRMCAVHGCLDCTCRQGSAAT